MSEEKVEYSFCESTAAGFVIGPWLWVGIPNPGGPAEPGDPDLPTLTLAAAAEGECKNE